MLLTLGALSRVTRGLHRWPRRVLVNNIKASIRYGFLDGFGGQLERMMHRHGLEVVRNFDGLGWGNEGEQCLLDGLHTTEESIFSK